MTVYFTLYFAIVLIYLVPFKISFNSKLFISFLLIFIYGAFRIDYGSDYSGYEKFFDDFHSQKLMDIDSKYEVGYQLLNMILPSYRMVIIVLTALLSISYYSLFKKYIIRKYIILAFSILFICTFSLIGQLTGLRNAIAINIFMLSITFIIDRKILYYFLMILLGSLFHTSALFMLPLYFITTPNIVTEKSKYVKKN